MRFYLSLILIVANLNVFAQIEDSTYQLPEVQDDLLEEYLQSNESEGEFGFDTYYDDAAYFAGKPLNINKCTAEDLQALRVLTESQIVNIIRYRENYGNIISKYELQAIPGMDLRSIDNLLPFVRLEGGFEDFRVPIHKMIAEGDNVLYLRWDRVLNEVVNDKKNCELDTTRNNCFKGDLNRLYARFRHTYENRLSYGITAEKDEGEEFFSGSNPQGFDFYSAHFALKEYKPWLKDLIIGDYAVSFGQGLILFSGFGSGKNAFATDIKKTERVIRPYTSRDEVQFLRGAAATIRPIDNIELTIFGSKRNRDGNLLDADTLEIDDDLREFSSLQLSGLHRTESEIADEGVIGLTEYGGNLTYKKHHFSIGANVLFTRFDEPLNRSEQLYNLFRFEGESLTNMSLDYSYVFRNFHFFGETALSDNGRVATINGLLIGLDRRLDLALLHRRLPPDYLHINADPFAESSQGNNEEGFYIGLRAQINNRWSMAAYYDIWNHPWLRSRVDAPSRGNEVFTRFTYYIKRKLEFYIQARLETKEANLRENVSPTDYIVETSRGQIRVNFQYSVSKALTLRNRIEFSRFTEQTRPNNYGYFIYQDIIFKPIGFPLSFTTRFGIFDTDDYYSRIYAYENDILNSFYIPSFVGRGTRFYINLRYRPINAYTFELRFERTKFINNLPPGFIYDSDGTITEGDDRLRVKAQVKIKF